MPRCATHLPAQRELGKLLDREGIKRLPSGVDLHPTQNRDDDGHDQSQEAAGVDDNVRVLGLDGVRGVCGFFLCGKLGTVRKLFKRGAQGVVASAANEVFSLPERTVSQADW